MLSTTSDEVVDSKVSLLLLMRMCGGSLTRVTPSLVQVILGVAVVESAVQYSQITDPSTMLWTPPLFWKRTFGRVVTVSWPFTAEDLVGGRGEGMIMAHSWRATMSLTHTVAGLQSMLQLRTHAADATLNKLHCALMHFNQRLFAECLSVRHIIMRTTAVIVSGHACIYVYMCACMYACMSVHYVFMINIQLIRIVGVLPSLWHSASAVVVRWRAWSAQRTEDNDWLGNKPQRYRRRSTVQQRDDRQQDNTDRRRLVRQQQERHASLVDPCMRRIGKGHLSVILFTKCEHFFSVSQNSSYAQETPEQR